MGCVKAIMVIGESYRFKQTRLTEPYQTLIWFC